ncbi:hypothetical protein EV356DRAFT_535985 [Viridothelium virens]|uniref:Uncharacterized protein n=1 Tax=Viridothelium virens TaxID=1048519 RepID=A0A6A6GZ81_VIRVR|nr:hypothetical protein EV356DRAFT_535985 [Viridothelium virens]
MASLHGEDEKSLQQMWDEAQTRFERMTEKSLKRSQIRSLREAVGVLDTSSDAEEADTSIKRQRLKAIASGALEFVQLVGGIAAQGASIVFGPATVCFSAAKMLMDIPAKISKFHEDLERLFGEISTFSKQFKIFSRVEQFTEVDNDLRKCIHKLMICFVDMCAISIKHLNRSIWGRIKDGTKVGLFNNDSGVLAKLEEFKVLIAYQSRICDGETWESALKTEKGVEVLKQNMKTSQKLMEESAEELAATHEDVRIIKAAVSKDSAERIDRIRDKLGIPSDRDADADKEFRSIRLDRLEGTGAWLKELEAYNKWRDFESQTNPLLMLIGDGNSGKSHLMSAMLDEQKDIHDNSVPGYRRVACANYGFERNEKSAREGAGKGSRLSILALKLMVIQIALQDVVYAQYLESNLKSKALSFTQDISAVDLVKELFPPPKLPSSLDAVYVLFFDGVDRLPPDEGKQLSEALVAIKSPNFRIAVTTSEDVSESLNIPPESSSSIFKIHVADHNEQDIRRYIEAEIRRHEDLNSEDPTILRIANTIRDRLPRVANGNFGNVHQIVEIVTDAVKTSSETDINSIEELISPKSLENIDKTSERVIDELNEILNAQEIEQLNELLIWVIYGWNFMSVEELRAAGLLRTTKTPLQKLGNKIREKYASVLKIEPNEDGQEIVYMRNEGLESFIQNMERPKEGRDLEMSDDPKISMSITFHNVKMSKARRFLWDLSEKVTFDRFDFGAPSSEHDPKSRINANPADGYLTLTRRCLAILLRNTGDNILGRYAVQYLPGHLSELMDEVQSGTITLEERKEVVGDLVSVLQRPERLDRDLTDNFLRWGCWTDPAPFAAWLNDIDSTKHLKFADREWLNDIRSAQPELILHDIALMIARHWLLDTRWPTNISFQWIDQFLDATGRSIGEVDNSHMDSVDNAIVDLAPDAESPNQAMEADDVLPTAIAARIQRAIPWVEKEMPTRERSGLWYERLGSTYLAYDLHKFAKENFLKAKTQGYPSWRTSAGLASAYAYGDSDRKAAVNEIEFALTFFREEKDRSKKETEEFAKHLRIAARWQNDLGNFDDSIGKLREAVKLEPQSFASHNDLLKTYHHATQELEALNFLKEMIEDQNTHLNGIPLGSLYLEYATWFDPVESFEAIFRTAKDDDVSNVAFKALDDVLEHARSEKKDESLRQLLLCHGIVSARHSIAANRLETALSHWMECYELGRNFDAVFLPMSSRTAAGCIFNHHFSIAKRRLAANAEENGGPPRPVDSVFKLDGMFNNDVFRLPLARVYSLSGNNDLAKKLLLNDMRDGLDILSDEDPDNDYWGYYQIANISMHIGDDLNALSGYSLWGPSGRYTANLGKYDDVESTSKVGSKNSGTEQGPLRTDSWKAAVNDRSNGEADKAKDEPCKFSCDGGCGKTLKYADSLWFCKVCADVQFEDACFAKLQDGTLTQFQCSRDHAWLKVPSWVDEFKATGKDQVRVGGEMVGGKRIGGEIIPVSEWLDSIRAMWGIEKPTKKKEPEPELESGVRKNGTPNETPRQSLPSSPDPGHPMNSGGFGRASTFG